MTIVVLGQHDRQRPEHLSCPVRRPPTELGGVAPPYVELSERETRHRTRPREAGDQRSHDQIRNGAEESIEKHGGARREHGVVEVRSPPIVMRSQMKREPEMLRNVIEERRREISRDERDDESDCEIHTCGDIVV